MFVWDAFGIWEAFWVRNRRMGDIVQYLRMNLGSFYMRPSLLSPKRQKATEQLLCALCLVPCALCALCSVLCDLCFGLCAMCSVLCAFALVCAKCPVPSALCSVLAVWLSGWVSGCLAGWLARWLAPRGTEMLACITMKFFEVF